MAFDKYLGFTSLLLHCDGTNDATTFTDSAQAFTVTPTSVVTKTAGATLKYGSAAAYFASSGVLAISTDAEFGMSTGDWTIEAWVHPTSLSAVGTIIDMHTGAVADLHLKLKTDGKLEIYNNGTSAISYTSTAALSTGVYTHVAIVRIGATTYVYINGVLDGSYSSVSYSATAPVKIGRNDAGTEPFIGYMDDIRITKGLGRYTAAFTPPTEAHPDAGTIHLSTFNGTNGASTFTEYFNRPWVKQSGTTVTLSSSFAKFGNAGLRIPVNNTGVARLSTGNKLWNLGTGDFTMEAWVYKDVSSGIQNPNFVVSTSPNRFGICFGFNSRSNLRVHYSTAGTSQTVSGVSSNAMTDNAWNYCAVSRVGANFHLNLNGTITTVAGTASALFHNTSTYIEGGGGSATGFTIDDFRVTKGFARFTTVGRVPFVEMDVGQLQQDETMLTSVEVATVGLTTEVIDATASSVVNAISIFIPAPSFLRIMISEAEIATGLTPSVTVYVQASSEIELETSLLSGRLVSADAISTIITLAAMANAVEMYVTMTETLLIVSATIPGQPAQVWVINMNTKAASSYDSFDFTSLINHAGKLYGISDSGLFLLEGDDDAGEPIDAFVLTGKMDFDAAELKRVPYVYAGIKADSGFEVSVLTDGGARNTYEGNATETTETSRVKVGNGLRSRYWQFEIRNIDGGSFDLESIEIMPTKQDRRIG